MIQAYFRRRERGEIEIVELASSWIRGRKKKWTERINWQRLSGESPFSPWKCTCIHIPPSRNNSLVGNEERAITNMEEKLQFFRKLASLKKKKKKRKTCARASRGAVVVVVRLPLFFKSFFSPFSPCNGKRDFRRFTLGRINAGTLDTFYANYPSSLYFCPLYILIYVRYIGNTPNAIVSLKGKLKKRKKKPRKTNPGI